MSSLELIQDFLSQKRICMVGVSRKSRDFSRLLFREFASRGYDMVAVNPDAAEIEGRPCFHSLPEVQPPADGVLFMTPPAVTAGLVDECAQAGVKRVWMYRAAGEGAASPETVDACRQRGMSVIPGECPFMFLPGANWLHRLHGLMRKVTGAYPR